MEITKFETSQSGCLIEGWWGQYAVARMIQIASEHGYGNPANVEQEQNVMLALRNLAEMGPSTTNDPLTDDEWTILHESADGVEMWMNENLAPEGYTFEWNDGEFFLVLAGDWDELDDLDIDVPADYVPQTDGWNTYPEDLDTSDTYDKEYDVP